MATSGPFINEMARLVTQINATSLVDEYSYTSTRVISISTPVFILSKVLNRKCLHIIDQTFFKLFLITKPTHFYLKLSHLNLSAFFLIFCSVIIFCFPSDFSVDQEFLNFSFSIAISNCTILESRVWTFKLPNFDVFPFFFFPHWVRSDSTTSSDKIKFS